MKQDGRAVWELPPLASTTMKVEWLGDESKEIRAVRVRGQPSS